jgi:hypothetical protein
MFPQLDGVRIVIITCLHMAHTLVVMVVVVVCAALVVVQIGDFICSTTAPPPRIVFTFKKYFAEKHARKIARLVPGLRRLSDPETIIIINKLFIYIYIYILAISLKIIGLIGALVAILTHTSRTVTFGGGGTRPRVIGCCPLQLLPPPPPPPPDCWFSVVQVVHPRPRHPP